MASTPPEFSKEFGGVKCTKQLLKGRIGGWTAWISSA